jgi:hypothetical protein
VFYMPRNNNRLFSDVITNNYDIQRYNPNVDDLASELRNIAKRQMFLKILQSLEQGDYGFKSLLPDDEANIIKIVYANESIEEKQKKLQNYMEELGKTFESQKSYLSLSGWANTLYYRWY